MSNRSQIRNHSRRLVLISLCAVLVSGLLAAGKVDKKTRAQLTQTVATAIPQHRTSSRQSSNLLFRRRTNPLAVEGIIKVNSTLQSPGASGECTLGEAIQAANTNLAVDGCAAGSSAGADTIMLPAGIYWLNHIAFNDAFFGAAGLPAITTDVIIQGAGSDSTIIERNPDASTQFRLLVIANQSAGSVVLNDLAMRGGRSPEAGGALYTAGRPATLNRVKFEDNRAVTYAGAVATTSQGGVLVANDCIFTNNQTNGQGGAIVASPATISNSTFTGNSAVYGGALYFGQGSAANFNITDSTFTDNHGAASAGIGGAIYFSGSATIHRSRFESNSAGSSNSSGGAIAGYGTLNLFDSVLNKNEANSGGGLHLSNCNFNISGTTISNNHALTHFGGGIYLDTGSGTVSASTINGNSAGIDGGGLWTQNNKLMLTNVTVDGNSCGQYGGGIYYAALTPLTLALNNVTLTANQAAAQGGGVFRYDYDGIVSAKNSIIALNTSGINNAPDIYAPNGFTSLGYNLIGAKNGASFSNAVGDQTGTSANPRNPLLGPLQNNGGTTSTRALLAGSPALDAASPSLPGSGGDACETTDQRGISRPQDGNNDGAAICDVGALEQPRVAVCVPPPAGLAGWWPFDDNADDIQNGNTMTLFGAPPFAIGKVAQSVKLDGADGYGVVPAAPALDLGNFDGLTFDVWINPGDVETAAPLIEWNDAAGIEGPHLWISADFAAGGRGPGSIFVNLRDTSSNYHIFSTGPGLLINNTWQHIAVTYDKTAGLAKIFLNGAPVAQQNLGSFRPQTLTDLYVGYRPVGVLAGRAFLGHVDELELFNRALSAEEIQSIYYADYAGKCKPDPSPTPTPTPTPATIEISEQIIVSDAVTLLPSAMIGVSENISVQDTPAVLPSAMIGVSENISVQDTPSLLPSAMIGIDENIAVQDTPALLPSAMIGINENIFVHDTPALLPSAMIGVVERISVLDVPSLLLTPIIGTVPTPVGSNVTVQAGNVTITFDKVTGAGTTTITPVDPALTGGLPNGYELAGTGLAFEITTTASYSGYITVCFSVPSVTDPTLFAKLRILHKEDGVLVDRTSNRDFPTRTICATVKSLSPFVLAQLSVAPHGVLQAIINDLKSLRDATADKRDQQRLDEIVKHLEGALASGNWLDEAHVMPNRGANVFGKIESAIVQLSALMKDKKTSVQSAALQRSINQLLQTTRLLAQAAVINATSANGNPSEIASALAALFEADAHVAAGNYNLAVSNYRESWRRATGASGH